MGNLLAVMAGGALGSAARYLVSVAVAPKTTGGFPYATLTVNLVGCFVIGCLATHFAATAVRPELRLGIVVGLLGGFTTFSSFGLEALQLLQAGRTGSAAAYVLISNIAGVALAYIGFLATRPTL